MNAGDRSISDRLRARNESPAVIPHPSMSLQSSGEIQAKFGVVEVFARSDANARERDQVRRAVRRPIADVPEVEHREVVVPVVAVDGVVAGPVGALQISLPRLVGGDDEVADVPGVDRVARVLLERVVEREPERAAACESDVVAVARVLLGEEVREQAGTRQEPVQVGSVDGVADDGAEVLVLEVIEEHVGKARHVRDRGAKRRRRARPAPRRSG